MTRIARISSRSPSAAASAWSKRRGNGFGPEWQCRSIAPRNTVVIALGPGIGNLLDVRDAH
ncbi:hypothetical protein LUX33_06490 [Actinomadura madurae]|nr:hypothetical protein [Actinomadura madurae]MCP9948093.1 hypothetical protein [Actinomadura madurae]MCP9964863.1 hypothetical protein [Actinomadura madurae]MCP9977352.1 hypothetical protein [Actinomadura madurae]